jgi:hypothetical protein
MSEILPNVIERKTELLGPNLQMIGGQVLEDSIMKFLFLRESEIFISCDWNFNLSTGYDVLTSLLKMSNDDYNFSPLVTVVDRMALDYIFLVLPTSEFTLPFKIVGPSQSMVYCCML